MLRYLLLLVLLPFALRSQTPGTVSESTSTTKNIIATSGPLVCILSNSSPSLASGVHVVCSISGSAVLSMDSVVPAGTNGMVGSFSQAGNSVTWLVNQPVASGPFAWQMAANGTAKSGTF